MKGSAKNDTRLIDNICLFVQQVKLSGTPPTKHFLRGKNHPYASHGSGRGAGSFDPALHVALRWNNLAATAHLKFFVAIFILRYWKLGSGLQDFLVTFLQGLFLGTPTTTTTTRGGGHPITTRRWGWTGSPLSNAKYHWVPEVVTLFPAVEFSGPTLLSPVSVDEASEFMTYIMDLARNTSPHYVLRLLQNYLAEIRPLRIGLADVTKRYIDVSRAQGKSNRDTMRDISAPPSMQTFDIYIQIIQSLVSALRQMVAGSTAVWIDSHGKEIHDITENVIKTIEDMQNNHYQRR